MQMREPVEQQNGEADDYRNDAEPEVDERSFIFSRRRSGDPEDQGESTENDSQKFDHGYSVGDAGLKPSAYTRDRSPHYTDQARLLVIEGWAQ
jgi:hypothetical protein